MITISMHGYDYHQRNAAAFARVLRRLSG